MKPVVKISSRLKTFLILGSILFLGAALRLYKLNYQSLWYDELHSVIPTDPNNTLSAIIEYCKTDQPPAFFLYLNLLFEVLAYNEIVARFSSVLLGILSIPVLYFLGKELGDHKTGLCAALLTAVNYFHIYYSQEARFYTMAFLFSALSYFFFIRAYKRKNLQDFIFYTVCTTILLYTHYYGLVIFISQAISFLILAIFYKRNAQFIIAGSLAGVAVIIWFIPWIPVILSDLGMTSFWLQKPTPYFIIEYFYNYFGKDAIVTALLAFLCFLFVKKMKKYSRDNENQPLHLILIFWIIFSYLIPYVKSVAGIPILHMRYTIITLPALIVIFAMGWSEIQKIKTKYTIILLVVMSSLINLIFFRKYYSKIQKQQFREASAMVKEKNTEGYPIYSMFSWHYNFYFRDSPTKVLHLDAADLSGVNKFWILQAELTSPPEEEIQKLKEVFVVIEEHKFYKSRALLMVRK